MSAATDAAVRLKAQSAKTSACTRAFLERITQRKLHVPRLCERAGELAKRSSTGDAVVADVLHAADIKTNCIKNVEHLPGELNVLQAGTSRSERMLRSCALGGFKYEQRANLRLRQRRSQDRVEHLSPSQSRRPFRRQIIPQIRTKMDEMAHSPDLDLRST